MNVQQPRQSEAGTHPDLELDLEAGRVLSSTSSSNLTNHSVDSFTWRDMQVHVKDRKTGDRLAILDGASGVVRAGEMLAIMGPSGSGKTTLLNALAHREAAAGASTTGSVRISGREATLHAIREASTYVEQEDALIGSLTVRETVLFAARMSLPR